MGKPKELLPCPFCGGEAIRTTLKLRDMLNPERKIECMKCEATTANFVHFSEAQKAWNRRTLPKDVYTVKISPEVKQWLEEPIDD